MPFSRSSSPESMTRSPVVSSVARAPKAPASQSMASTRVVLPWSTWATMATLRRSWRTLIGGTSSAGRTPRARHRSGTDHRARNRERLEDTGRDLPWPGQHPTCAAPHLDHSGTGGFNPCGTANHELTVTPQPIRRPPPPEKRHTPTGNRAAPRHIPQQPPAHLPPAPATPQEQEQPHSQAERHHPRRGSPRRTQRAVRHAQLETEETSPKPHSSTQSQHLTRRGTQRPATEAHRAPR